MSTTGCRVGTRVVSQPSSRQRGGGCARPLGRAAFALEDVGAHRLVDRGEMAVQELLGVVRVRADVRALAQLQHRLLRGRPVAARARDETIVVGDRDGPAQPSASSTAAGSHGRPRRGRAAIAATAQV